MRRLGDTLLLATHNAGKRAEMAALLAPYGVTVTSAADHGLPEPAETGETFVENARLKARAALEATGLPALADDSGMEVEGLQGRPGVHTADWAEGPEGRDFALGMTRVHDALEGRFPSPARFVSTLVLLWPNGEEQVFEGAVDGRVVWPPRGQGGHGFDPMFEPEGLGRTFAEMTEDEKNALSHRGRSVRAFIDACLR
jgi:XTP/dITP diphosphohydrolase